MHQAPTRRQRNSPFPAASQEGRGCRHSWPIFIATYGLVVLFLAVAIESRAYLCPKTSLIGASILASQDTSTSAGYPRRRTPPLSLATRRVLDGALGRTSAALPFPAPRAYAERILPRTERFSRAMAGQRIFRALHQRPTLRRGRDRRISACPGGTSCSGTPRGKRMGDRRRFRRYWLGRWRSRDLRYVGSPPRRVLLAAGAVTVMFFLRRLMRRRACRRDDSVHDGLGAAISNHAGRVSRRSHDEGAHCLVVEGGNHRRPAFGTRRNVWVVRRRWPCTECRRQCIVTVEGS